MKQKKAVEDLPDLLVWNHFLSLLTPGGMLICKAAVPLGEY